MADSRQPLPSADLPPPLVSSLLPDDPQWDETGLLPAQNTLQPLPTTIAPWAHNPIPGTSTVLNLYWVTGLNSYLVEERVWPSNAYPDSIPPEQLEFEVPTRFLVQGIHELWYDLAAPNGGFYESGRQVITIDLTPPSLGTNQGALVFDTTAITPQYLIDHADKVIAQVPLYSVLVPGDKITWYWNADPFDVAPGDVVDERTLERGDTQPLAIEFSGDMIRSRGDGERYAFYKLSDRAGNPLTTVYSRAVKLDVQVHIPVRDLPSPTIAEATGAPNIPASTLKPYDARAGATVVIPDEAVLLPGDVLSVQWALPGAQGAYLATVPDASGKRFSIPSANIPQHMGNTIPVYYLVNSTVPPEESRKHQLTVAFLEAGRWSTIQCTRPAGADTQLSLKAVDSFATFTLLRWMFMADGQRLSITLSGVGQPPLAIRNDYPVVEGDITAGKIATDVSKAILQGFTLDEQLTVSVNVSFDGGASTVVFPPLKLTLVA